MTSAIEDRGSRPSRRSAARREVVPDAPEAVPVRTDELPILAVESPRISLRHVGRLVVAVDVDGVCRGYIESVGRVFVALAGARYDTSVEVGQALTLDRALDHLRP